MKKKKKKSISGSIFMYSFAVFILLISLIAVVYSDFSKVIVNQKETRKLQKEYDLLKEEEASLNVEVTKMQDPDYISRYAREKYMFSKDGEIILRIVPPSDEDEVKEKIEE